METEMPQVTQLCSGKLGFQPHLSDSPRRLFYHTASQETQGTDSFVV